VLAVPGSSRAQVLGPHEGALRVALSAPAERGRANAQLEEVIALRAGVARRQVSLRRGSTARRKQVHVETDEVDAVVARLCAS